MKYIRTKYGIYEYVDYDNEHIISMPIIKCRGILTYCAKRDIIKQANTIEELCDEFVVVSSICCSLLNKKEKQDIKRYAKSNLFGAIWCEWGLKYVAKMNSKGELELL